MAFWIAVPLILLFAICLALAIGMAKARARLPEQRVGSRRPNQLRS